MNKLNIHKNIQYNTQLLESLDWDEEALQSLLEFLDVEFASFETKHPLKIIEIVTEYFGEDTSKVLSKIFSEQVIFNNMHKVEYKDEN
tara:strand:- start:569 stop:832 length:264 start_codon:yes stop_codon:yes gene_type:complete